jgi:hypothetical protein
MYITGIVPDTVDAAQQFALGTLGGTAGVNGIKVYVYGKGVASCAVGSWCTFDEAWWSLLATHQKYGVTGVAKSAVEASKFGWFQVYGYNGAASFLTAAADNSQPYTSATAGSLDDAASSKTMIAGAVCRALVGGATANVAVSLAWPQAAAYGAAAA